MQRQRRLCDLGFGVAFKLVHAESSGQVFDPNDLAFGVVPKLMQAESSGQVFDPNDLAFGVVPKLAHAEPGQTCAPDDFTTGLGVAGSFAPFGRAFLKARARRRLGVDDSFASTVERCDLVNETKPGLVSPEDIVRAGSYAGARKLVLAPHASAVCGAASAPV